ncbi:putative succinate-semialdehyde dehydrogenase (NAD(+)) [Helianthus anomalus]
MGDAPKIGNSLLESPQVRKITFTGLTAVGKKLMAGAAETVKKVSLELGGNAPCIAFDDADLEVALKGSVSSLFNYYITYMMSERCIKSVCYAFSFALLVTCIVQGVS